MNPEIGDLRGEVEQFHMLIRSKVYPIWLTVSFRRARCYEAQSYNNSLSVCWLESWKFLFKRQGKTERQ